MRRSTARRYTQRRFDNLDASENAFFARALEVVKAGTYDQRFPSLRAREFIPIDNSVDRAATTVTIRGYSQVGMAKLIASYADDLPRADVKAEERSVQIKSMGDSYGYNLQEIRAAQRAGADLETRKANAARRAMEILVDRILALGDAATGLIGLLNIANALTYVVPNGAGGTADWASKTPSEILADMIGIAEYVPTQTAEVETVDTLLMPRAQFTRISTTQFSLSSDKTILDFFRANYQSVNVASWDKLKTAGSGSTARMVAYRRDPNVLQGIIPQEFEQLPAQERGLEFVVPCHGRIGGVVAYYPLAIAYGDGI